MISAKKIKKTNAARLLDELGISYNLISYPVDLDDLSAIRAASSTGIDPNSIFKSIVLQDEHLNYLMALCPATRLIDLKALALASNSKSLHLLPLNQLFKVTGYRRGGCSPLATKKPLLVFIDQCALSFPIIAVSAGLRGLLLLLSPRDLLAASHALLASFSIGDKRAKGAGGSKV